jgi:Lrp/AsnC ligand binding domain
VFLISGHFDLVVHVTVRDLEHLKDLISDHFKPSLSCRAGGDVSGV